MVNADGTPAGGMSLTGPAHLFFLAAVDPRFVTSDPIGPGGPPGASQLPELQPSAGGSGQLVLGPDCPVVGHDRQLESQGDTASPG